MSCEMQYIIWRGTFSPAAKHAAKDAEKFMAMLLIVKLSVQNMFRAVLFAQHSRVDGLGINAVSNRKSIFYSIYY